MLVLCLQDEQDEYHEGLGKRCWLLKVNNYVGANLIMIRLIRFRPELAIIVMNTVPS